MRISAEETIRISWMQQKPFNNSEKNLSFLFYFLKLIWEEGKVRKQLLAVSLQSAQRRNTKELWSEERRSVWLFRSQHESMGLIETLSLNHHNMKNISVYYSSFMSHIDWCV